MGDPEKRTYEDAAPSPDALSGLAERREAEVREALCKPDPRFRWETDTPELHKQLRIILTRLAEMRRLLRQRDEGPKLAPTQANDVRRALDTKVESYATHLGTCTEYADSLERLLVNLGGPVYIHTLLLREVRRDDTDGDLRWGEFFSRKELNRLVAAYDKPELPDEKSLEHRSAVDRLNYLFGLRSHIHHRHARARSRLKSVYLWRLAAVLFVLLVLLCAAVFWNDGSKGLVLASTVAAAGALGSALTGVFKVRDELSRIGDLRLFGSALVVQPLVGASAGLLLLMVLDTGLPGFEPVTLEKARWTTFASYAFIAGFSEPFFLGIVQRVAATAERKPTK
jgi:hypothetical protein